MNILNKLKTALLVTSVMLLTSVILLPTISYAVVEGQEYSRTVQKPLQNAKPMPIYPDFEEGMDFD